MEKKFAASMLMASALVLSLHAEANLLVNGGFELGSHSTVVTPTGWTNIGHSDGVLAYSNFSLPAYEGLYFYDLGGFGNPFGPVGDGIMQTVATVAGTPYTLNFGLSSEDNQGPTTLRVMIGSAFSDFTLTPTGTFLGKGMTTQTINYLATGASTTIQFIEFANAGGGNNDPLIDGVIFAAAGPTTVPEPMSVSLLGVGLAGLAFARRRKKIT